MSKKTFVLVAGGTGGHVFPAISFAKFLKNAGHKVILCTDERGKKFTENVDFFTKIVSVSFNRKYSILGKFSFYFSMLFAGLKSFIGFIFKRPSAVIGFGGYASAPYVLAAQILRIKNILHEQNAVIGKTNLILSKRAAAVATGVFNVKKCPKDKKKFVGIPVRNEIKKMYNKDYNIPQNEFFNLLLLGGSQGAKFISEKIPEIILSLPKEIKKKIHIIQQAREESIEKIESLYIKNDVSFEIKSFFNKIEDQYSKSHFVITRGGASTLAELALCGVPAIIIPFPFSTEDHQFENARYYSENGGAVIFNELHDDINFLFLKIKELFSDEKKLHEMSKKMKEKAIYNAEENLYNLL